MQKELPVIPCLVFIRTNYRKALSLLQNSSFDISYIKHPETQKLHTIPDKQMQDFMLVLNFSTATFIMENSSLRRGERVRVTKGEFTGIEGELVRLKGHKRIVVRLEGLVSAVTTYVPGKYLEQIASTK
jgi:transcription antitermination factor NusG